MNLRDFCFDNFHWIGRPLNKMFRNLESNLDSAAMGLHPEIYLSILGFISILSIGIPVVLLSVSATYSALTGISIFPLNILYNAAPNVRLAALLLLAMTPFLVIIFGVTFPKLVASNRTSKLKIEIPYASMYMSVMTSGGLSPYQSLIRMTEINLLPTLQEEMKRLQKLVVSSGSDPISAMEQAVKVINIKDVSQRIIHHTRRGILGPDKRIHLTLSGSGIYLPAQQATTCALVINELLQNAVEHGYERKPGGTISVNLRDDGDKVVVAVMDDGQGLPEDFTLEQADSLGLQIVQTLVRDDLKGQFELREGEGVSAIVTFPKQTLGGEGTWRERG